MPALHRAAKEDQVVGGNGLAGIALADLLSLVEPVLLAIQADAELIQTGPAGQGEAFLRIVGHMQRQRDLVATASGHARLVRRLPGAAAQGVEVAAGGWRVAAGIGCGAIGIGGGPAFVVDRQVPGIIGQRGRAQHATGGTGGTGGQRLHPLCTRGEAVEQGGQQGTADAVAIDGLAGGLQAVGCNRRVCLPVAPVPVRDAAAQLREKAFPQRLAMTLERLAGTPVGGNLPALAEVLVVGVGPGDIETEIELVVGVGRSGNFESDRGEFPRPVDVGTPFVLPDIAAAIQRVIGIGLDGGDGSAFQGHRQGLLRRRIEIVVGSGEFQIQLPADFQRGTGSGGTVACLGQARLRQAEADVEGVERMGLAGLGRIVIR